MGKKYTAFLTPASPGEGFNIQTDEHRLKYIELDEKTREAVLSEASLYTVQASVTRSYEYDDDDYPSRSYDSYTAGPLELVSLSSPLYSTNDVLADILVIDGEFAGIVVKHRKWGGSGWSNYDYSWYTVIYKDGRISGTNLSEYSFSGSSSSKEEETVYYLNKNEE